MNGPDGSVLRRPDSEEPVEYDGVCHLFMATLADVDPFNGHVEDGSIRLRAAWAPLWINDPRTGELRQQFGKLHKLWQQIGAADKSAIAGDDLVLWPTLDECAVSHQRDGVPTQPGERLYLQSLIEAST